MTSATMTDSKSSQTMEAASLQEESTNQQGEVLESAMELKAKEAVEDVEDTAAKQQETMETAMESKSPQVVHEAAMEQNIESPKARTPIISIKNQEEFAREWQIRYTELSQYQSQHGHCAILNVNYDNESIQLVRRLCRWMIEQRQLRGEGLLSRARFDLLNLLDFDWSRKAHNDDLWMQSFFCLIDYKNKYGHCNVPQKKEKQYQQLGRWVKKQREEAKRNALRADRVQKLNDIEFTWSFPTARFHLERMTNPSMADALTADATPSSTVTENDIAMGASINVAAVANNSERMQQEQDRLASQEEELRNYLEESKKRQLRMQKQQPQQVQRPLKKQRMQEDVIVIDDDNCQEDTDTEEGDDSEEALASSRMSSSSSAWNNEDDTILGELYQAQYQLYHAQSQMYHAQSRVHSLKEKLATRMQSRSVRQQYYKSTKHLEDELRKQQRKKRILRLELQRQQHHERKESSQSFNGAAHYEGLLDEQRHQGEQVQQQRPKEHKDDQEGVSPPCPKPAIVEQQTLQQQQKTQQTSDAGVQAASLARDVFCLKSDHDS